MSGNGVGGSSSGTSDPFSSQHSPFDDEDSSVTAGAGIATAADCLVGGGGSGASSNRGSVVDSNMMPSFADLGRLDDSMMRLLAASEPGAPMDQQIADPITEEHLKS